MTCREYRREEFKGPAALPRHEVKKVDRYWEKIDAAQEPMRARIE